LDPTKNLVACGGSIDVEDEDCDTARLHRLVLILLFPSADNRSPDTESQVFRRFLTYVGTGFDVEVADVVSSRTRSRSSKGVNVGAKRMLSWIGFIEARSSDLHININSYQFKHIIKCMGGGGG
jgi:hypothetical protein